MCIRRSRSTWRSRWTITSLWWNSVANTSSLYAHRVRDRRPPMNSLGGSFDAPSEFTGPLQLPDLSHTSRRDRHWNVAIFSIGFFIPTLLASSRRSIADHPLPLLRSGRFPNVGLVHRAPPLRLICPISSTARRMSRVSRWAQGLGSDCIRCSRNERATTCARPDEAALVRTGHTAPQDAIRSSICRTAGHTRSNRSRDPCRRRPVALVVKLMCL